MKRALILFVCAAIPAVAFGRQEMSWQGKSVGQWVEQLADQDERARWYATYALGQIGPQAAGAAEPLARILKEDPHEYVRDGAAWALGRIGPEAELALDVLIAALDSRLPSIRRNSARALGRIGPAAKPAVAALERMLQDRDATVRVNAAEALWKMDRHAAAIPALVKIIDEGAGAGPYQAVIAIGRLEAPPDTAISALTAALGHAEADVRRAAARAMGEIGPTAVPLLTRALADANDEVRRGAVEALRWIGPAAVPQLIAALKNDRPVVRRMAARALGRLGPAAREAEAALLEAVRDPDPQVRQMAHWARRKIRTE